MSEVVTVGPREADFCGSDNRAIQAGVEAVAGRGGGVVKLQPGTYLLEDSIHLRDNVALVGAGAETILRKGPERSSQVVGYLGYGHYDVFVKEPEKFAVGMGVTVDDANGGGFYGTIGTLTWRDGDRFGLSEMLNHDYSSHSGEIYTSFPPISAKFVSGVTVRDLVVEGNREENPHVLNGCRGGGVFLLAVRGAAINNVEVRNLNGDGISFQQCREVRIEDCVLADNAGHGLHPGSGTVGAIMRRCRAVGNGRDGVFFCLRATYMVCEACEFVDNGGRGVSIGGRDTNNAIIECIIERNGGAGVFLRRDEEAMAPHTTLLSRNVLADNCRETDDAEIVLATAARDVHVLDNALRRGPGLRPVPAVYAGPTLLGAHLHGNRCEGEFAGEFRSDAPPESVSLESPQEPLAVGPEAAPPHADRHLPPRVRVG